MFKRTVTFSNLGGHGHNMLTRMGQVSGSSLPHRARGDFRTSCPEIPRSEARNAANAAFLCIAKRCYVHDLQGSEQ